MVQNAKDQTEIMEVALGVETEGKKDRPLYRLHPPIAKVCRTPLRNSTMFLSISCLMLRSMKL